jgi:cytochrome c553
MTLRQALLVRALNFAIFAAPAKDHVIAAQASLPSAWVPSGDAMDKQFCAVCHGQTGEGMDQPPPHSRRGPRT